MINTGDISGGKYLLLISILNTIFVLNDIEQLNSSTRFTHVKSLHFSRPFRDTTIQNMLLFPIKLFQMKEEWERGMWDCGRGSQEEAERKEVGRARKQEARREEEGQTLTLSSQ